jgi:hypothetical protein
VFELTIIRAAFLFDRRRDSFKREVCKAMKEEPTITLKAIIYEETGKSITDLIKESFFNFYFAKSTEKSLETACKVR